MRSISLLFSLSLIACGGDDDGGGGIKVPDASMQPMIDAPMQASCAAMVDYGSPTPMQVGVLRFCATQTALVKCPSTATQGTTGTTTDPLYVVYLAQLNTQNDFFQLELWKTSMNMPVAPASNVNLGDATNSQWKTCAVCAYVSAQVNLQSGMDMGTYLANAGTANITTVTLADAAANTRFAGSVSNVNMLHVDIAMDGTSTANADGCTTKLTALSFDRAMADPMMQFTGEKADQLYDYVLKRLNTKYAKHFSR